NFQWIVTDAAGNILGLPPTFSVVDFDEAGAGNCLVWYLRYDGEISGLAAGLNANDLEGCFSLSNPVEVIRMNEGDCQANGGVLFGGPFEFTVGDGAPDMIPEDAITVANSQGENAQWVITDDQGNILGLPPTFSVVDFDVAGPGTCLVWYLRYDGEITGLAMDANANDLEGCFSLSNPIEVVRTEVGAVNGGELAGGPFEFCVGDDTADVIPEDAITLTGAVGDSSQWVITDGQGVILGLPPSFSVVNFDVAGPGTCLVWHLSFNGDVVGLEADANANDLVGDFSLSNPIEVIRNQPEGGTLVGGPFTFCVDDDLADMIGEDEITLTDNSGEFSHWVVTDDMGTILGLPPTFSAVNFEGVFPGTCLVWHLSYYGDIQGLEEGANAEDLMGCFSLSNPIEVVRQTGDDCGSGFTFPTVVISEVAANGFIELYNNTDMEVNVSNYWLCNFPTYTRVSDLQLECGNLLIQPGEVTVVSGFSAFNDTDAELGLYSTNAFSSPDALVSYLEWGSSGHTRANVAIAAGVWVADFFLTMPATGNSLQQVINDNAPEWISDIASFCEVNPFGSTSTNEFANESGRLLTFPNPASQFLSVETTDFDNGSSTLRLFNLNGQIVLERELDYTNGLTELNISQLQAGTYLLQLSNAKSAVTRRVVVTN
ncbi:MAG: T9SS type A sorting domain-containing protein, partial [Bacteroidota bacterium]